MINLRPPELKEDVKYAKYNVTLVQYMIVALGTVGVIIFLMLFGKQTLTNTKNDIERLLATDRAKAAALQEVNQEATTLSATVDTIGALLDEEVKFSYLLREIGSIMPPGAKLSALSLSQDSTQPVRLTVDLVTAEKAGVLQQNLLESRLFIGADILSVAQAGAGTTYGFAADLQAYYDPDFPLNSLDDPVEEATPDASQTPEAKPNEEEPTAPQESSDDPETSPPNTEEDTNNGDDGVES